MYSIRQHESHVLPDAVDKKSSTAISRFRLKFSFKRCGYKTVVRLFEIQICDMKCVPSMNGASI